MIKRAVSPSGLDLKDYPPDQPVAVYKSTFPTQKDVFMAAQAAMKSTLESPTVQFLATGMPEDKIPGLIKKYAELGVDIVLDILATRGPK